MSQRNVIQTTFDAFGREAGFYKRSGTWYRRQTETIAVLNLQKSQYGPQYYVNVALWLLPLGEADAPKAWKCHIGTRLEMLLSPERAQRVPALFDLDAAIDDDARRDEILDILADVLPLFEAWATVDGLRSSTGARLLKRSVATREAQELVRAGDAAKWPSTRRRSDPSRPEPQ